MVNELDGEEVGSVVIMDDRELRRWVFDTSEGPEECGCGGFDVTFRGEVGSDEVAVYCIEGGVVVTPAAGVSFIGFIDDEDI